MCWHCRCTCTPMEFSSRLPSRSHRWRRPAPFFSGEDAGSSRKSDPDRGKRNWGGRNGIEPSSPGWSPGALPKLCYSRECREPRHTKIGDRVLTVNKNRSRSGPARQGALSLRAVGATPDECVRGYTLFYRARARTSVTSSGCSLSPIQSSTAWVTI